MNKSAGAHSRKQLTPEYYRATPDFFSFFRESRFRESPGPTAVQLAERLAAGGVEDFQHVVGRASAPTSPALGRRSRAESPTYIQPGTPGSTNFRSDGPAGVVRT